MKTLILNPKSRLYVQSQGVACNVSATTHLMELLTESPIYPEGGGDEGYEKVAYSVPQQNNVNTLIEYTSVATLKRVIREIYLYNEANTTQGYSIRIRTYLDITLLVGTEVGKLDDPLNYTDTCLIDVSIPAAKVWRLSEAFLLSYPSVIVLKNGAMDELSIVTAPTGVEILTADDKVHVTMSHGITGQTDWGINETLTQTIISGTANTSIYKLPAGSTLATVIKQICVYNASGKTVRIKIGFGPAISTNLQSYIFDDVLAPNKSWWSDAGTFQKIEDYIALADASGTALGPALGLNAVLPLEYTPAGRILKIGQVGAVDRQVLGWDAMTMEWRPQDNMELLTPVFPLEYNMLTLKLLIGQNNAVDGQGLVWRTANNRWEPGTVGAPTTGSAGLSIDGGDY